MSATVTQIRSGLATRLATISGLRTSAVEQDSVNVPMAVVMPPESVTYNGDVDGQVVYMFPVILMVSAASNRNAQSKLDPYLAPTGSSSVLAAVHGDGTLGGVVDYTTVQQVRSYGDVVWGSETYIGAEFLIEVVD